MSIISCTVSRLKRDEQTETYVHFESNGHVTGNRYHDRFTLCLFLHEIPDSTIRRTRTKTFSSGSTSHGSRHALLGLLHGTRWFANGTPDY